MGGLTFYSIKRDQEKNESESNIRTRIQQRICSWARRVHLKAIPSRSQPLNVLSKSRFILFLSSRSRDAPALPDLAEYSFLLEAQL
jgi:hypothetical protein